jgi:hypothetical protein
MANPNVITAASATLDILVESQLASGNNDFTVPSGKAWTLDSITLTNTSGSVVSVTLSVIKSGSSARRIVPTTALAAAGGTGDSLVIDPIVLRRLPEAAVLRINATAGTAVDVLVTGVVTA